MNGSKIPHIKTVNGKKMGDKCVVCGDEIANNIWICIWCVNRITTDVISDVVNNMPEYLGEDQYENWLRMTLLKYANESQKDK